MPGLNFFGKLNELSNHYIDWERAGNLLAQGGHHYSYQELVDRAILLAGTASAAFLAYHLNDESQTGLSSLAATMIGGTLGLAVAHIPVVYPLIQKRRAAHQACIGVENEINDILDSNSASDELRTKILSDVKTAMNSSTHSESGKKLPGFRVWGARLRLLTEIREELLETLQSSHRLTR